MLPDEVGYGDWKTLEFGTEAQRLVRLRLNR